MMPHLASVKKCTGCTACYTSCVHAAIRMLPDGLGFPRPIVDEKLCVGCGACERACSVISVRKECYPIRCYAARTKDRETLLKSSSGGIFSELAQQVIRAGGVVYGCVFDDSLRAVHARADALWQIDAMRGSKYVQSDLTDTFLTVKKDLSSGRRVLFSGTPCQILGLKTFLHKPYEDLISIGVICHGVPAPEMFEYYKQCEERKAGSRLKSFSFRDKHYSWQQFSIALDFVDKEKNMYISQWGGSYMCIFNRNYMMRESCFHCPARTGRSECDLLIGDYWGVERAHPQLDWKLGYSCVLAYTEKGLRLFESLPTDCINTTYLQVKKANANIESNPKRPFGIDYFRDNFSLRKNFDDWTKWVFWGPWWLRPFCPVLHWQEFKGTWIKACYHFVRDLFTRGR